MIKMVRRYFGRIPRGKTEPPEVTTLEEKQHGERRLIAEAETNPEAEIWYHTVAWKHPDSYPLEVLAGIMSGKTGRLYKKLVEQEGIAKSSVERGGMRMFGGEGLAVSAVQDSRKYAGAFEMSAEGVSGVRAEQLEKAMESVIEDLKTDLVTEEELQKVKNRLRVQQIRFMDIMSGIGILFYLGQNVAYGDWEEANNAPAKIDLVTAEDVRRVADKYFTRDGRDVLIINTEGGGEAESEGGGDPRFAQAVTMIKAADDPAMLERMIGMFSTRLEGIEDPEERAQMEELLKVANERLKELKSGEGM
jgi:predicted Zn-dependent peptidase